LLATGRDAGLFCVARIGPTECGLARLTFSVDMLSIMIQVRVLAFGVLKDVLGGKGILLGLNEGATVADLLAEVERTYPTARLHGIAVSVNAEYANGPQILHDKDEVGLLPPVSGGSAARAADTLDENAGGAEIVARLTRERIDVEDLVAAAKQSVDGAVVVFDGIVRNNTRGRETLSLDYEAYEEMAAKQMGELAARAREKFGVRHVTVVHRLGRLMVGETSVLIAVAAAHRGQAFDACRWMIDTLKKTVPIWKKETFVDGAVWADGEPFPDGWGVEAKKDAK
jgi:molybdopterin synthase catalytic subunit/molybdopterin converting factor small subunit